MTKYKCIGILGGMGPQATAELYNRIIRIFQQQHKATLDSEFPEIIIVNLPIPDVVTNPLDLATVKEMLIDAVRRIDSIGADFIVIPCNTVMQFIQEMQDAVTIPLINIVEVTANQVQKDKLKTVGLLGTKMTISSNMYSKFLGGIKIIIPSTEEQEEITKIILRVLSGKINNSDAETIDDIIGKMKNVGAEKVILGCTELPLLVQDNSKTIDTLQILAHEAVRKAVE